MKKPLVITTVLCTISAIIFLSCPRPTGGGSSSPAGGGGTATFTISLGGVDLASGGSRDLGLVKYGNSGTPTVFTILNTGTLALPIDDT
jgi:hypothetical protein